MPSGLYGLTTPSPAWKGLARQKLNVALEPEWATKLTNAVIDGEGRLAARKGWTKTNASAISGTPIVRKLHEYVNKAGTVEWIVATASDIFSGLSTPSSIKGALTPSAGNWQFINFNGKCLGWQSGETPIVYTGTGNFAAISAGAGTLPDGPCAWSAFGRVWAVDDDLQTIRYCALLDETDWSTASGGGSIDMSSVWTQGMDQVVAITSYGSALIVFGKRHIVFWTDGAGSEIGLNPSNMYVGEIIEGVGLVSRDCFALVGEQDVVFWSSSGVRSLQRVLQEKATPLNQLSGQNRDYLADALSVGDTSKCTMAYSPRDGFVMLAHPDNGNTFVFDVRAPLEDGSLRTSEWTLAPTALAVGLDRETYFGSPGATADGLIGKYTGYQDNGSSYLFTWWTGWMLVPPGDRLKALKRAKFFMYTLGNLNGVFSWWVDWRGQSKRVAPFSLDGGGDEWNVDEWALMEWGAAQAYHELFLPLGGTYQYLRCGVDVTINGSGFAIQSFTLYNKGTRIA